MVRICRNFTLSICTKDAPKIEAKLEKLRIYFKKKCFEAEVGDKKVGRVYFECTAEVDAMEKLIDYLNNKYRNTALLYC